jgi:ribosomal-protein-alanine N-acetyltransferase
MSELKPMRLESPRLQLREAVNGDAEILFVNYFSSVSSSRFLSRFAHSSIEQTKRFLDQWTNQAWKLPGTPFAWIIEKLEDAEPIGIFLVFQKDSHAEIHYGISETCRGQGFASEACDTATKWLLSQNLIQKVWTAVDIEHVATQRVLEKAGFQKGEILRNWAVLPAFGSQARDAIAYSKSKSFPIK